MRSRDLAWDGCLNVRDLGGLPTAGGGTTRFGQVVRADNVRRLTEAGWRSARAYGVQRIVDLRSDSERAADSVGADGFDVVTVPLLGPEDPDEARHHDDLTRRAPDDASATAAFYLDALETRSEHVAAAVRAVARAPDGAVVVHCFVGKDRTGIIAALLLRLAGVPDDAVIQDYASSGLRIAPLVDRWIEAVDDEHERAFRRRVSAAPAEGLRRVLAGVRDRWGGEEAYLLRAGVDLRDLERTRARLVA